MFGTGEWVEREGITFEYVMAADVSPSVEARVLEPNLQVVDLDGDQLPEMVPPSQPNFLECGARPFQTWALSSFFRNLQLDLFLNFQRCPYGLHGRVERDSFSLKAMAHLIPFSSP